MRLIAQSVSGLRLFQFHAGDDVTGVRFRNFVELFTLHGVQRAQPFRNAAARVINGRVRTNFAAEDLEDVDASGKWISDRAETISRERFVV